MSHPVENKSTKEVKIKVVPSADSVSLLRVLSTLLRTIGLLNISVIVIFRRMERAGQHFPTVPTVKSATVGVVHCMKEGSPSCKRKKLKFLIQLL